MLQGLFLFKLSETLAFFHTQNWKLPWYGPLPTSPAFSHPTCASGSLALVLGHRWLLDVSQSGPQCPLPCLGWCYSSLHLECSFDLLISYLSFKVMWTFLLYEIFIKIEVTSPSLEVPEFSYRISPVASFMIIYGLIKASLLNHEFFKGKDWVLLIYLFIFQCLARSGWSLNSDWTGVSLTFGFLILKQRELYLAISKLNWKANS